MERIVIILVIALALLPLSSCSQQATATPVAQQIERGKYLVTVGGCNDCHTPLKMGPNGPEPDFSRALSGHPAQVKMTAPPKTDLPWAWSGSATNTAFAGPWGISYAKNLTPDPVTGLGIWDEKMFITTLRTGKHMGVSRPILPPMPWFNYAKMSDDDLKSVFAYLRSIKPIRNEVPDAVIAGGQS